MKRGALSISLIIVLVLGLIAGSIIAWPFIGSPIVKIIKGLVGQDFFGKEDNLPTVDAPEFRAHFADAYTYCGIGEVMDHCKCPIAISPGRYYYLKGEGEGRTMLASFSADDDPELGAWGQVLNQQLADVEQEKFGPLCLHAGNYPWRKSTGLGSMPMRSSPQSIAGVPPDADLPASDIPDRLDHFGIVLTMRSNGKLAWTSNVIAPNQYQEWATQPAVYWRKSDNAHCFWGPWVEDPLLRAPKLLNIVPDCSQRIPLENIASAAAQFDEFLTEVGKCLAIQKQPDGKLLHCSQYTFTLPEGLEVRQRLMEPPNPKNPPKARMLQLEVPATKQVIAEHEFPSGVQFCIAGKADDPTTWNYGTVPLPKGIIKIMVDHTNAVCFGAGVENVLI